jgi:hypothetical protein
MNMSNVNLHSFTLGGGFDLHFPINGSLAILPIIPRLIECIGQNPRQHVVLIENHPNAQIKYWF